MSVHVCTHVGNTFARQHRGEQRIQDGPPACRNTRTALEDFLVNLRNLPCWVDGHLSGNVFGAKFSRDYWLHIFKHGTAQNGTPVLTAPLDIKKMITVAGGEPVGV